MNRSLSVPEDGKAQSVEGRIREIEKSLSELYLLRRDENADADAIAEIKVDLKHQTQAINRLEQQLVAFGHFAFVNNLLPIGPFLTRYQEYYWEKRALAEFVSKSFFTGRTSPQRCFFQASTTALHVVEVLDRDPAIHSSCLIYSNSAVAHLPLLFGRSSGKHSIWPFRGHSFDPVCAGWLIPPGDDTSFDELRKLFKRPNDPLRLSFLMPRWIGARALFYERSDTVMFAENLALADEIVVLATGDRVLPPDQNPPPDRMCHPALESTLQNSPQKVTYIVSWPAHPIPEYAAVLRRTVGRLWWYSKAGWTDVAP